MCNSIDILLSTYNGEKYLEQQIDSILKQYYMDWRLIVRDDGSKDNTIRLLMEYKRSHPDRMVILRDQLGNLGPVGSYCELAKFSTAPYIAFCDQDDVWKPDKLVEQMEAIRICERGHGIDHPVLVHSDLNVVSEDLQILAESYWEMRAVKSKDMNTLRFLLTKNYVTGCTLLINRALLELSLPFPQKIIMHDWWMALIAAANGTIVDMPEKTVCYRQHASNVVAGGGLGVDRILRAVLSAGLYLKDYMRITRDQAEEMLRFGKLDDDSMKIVKEYVQMYNRNWLHRRVAMIRNGYFEYGFIKKLLILIYM